VAFAAHFTDVRDVGDVGEMHVGPNGRYVGLGPIGGATTTVALVVPRRDARSFTPDEFRSELERFPALTGRFGDARMVRPVLATGPFSQRSSRVTGDGVCLVGDAADFFDPFTGQGIYNALRTAELAARAITAALADPAPVTHAALDPYVRARRTEFAGKWVLERLIGFGVGWGALTERVVTRLAQQPDLADLLVGATGNFVPARRVLHPRFLHSIVW
jgi:flavin-dependent dehydrogenase